MLDVNTDGEPFSTDDVAAAGGDVDRPVPKAVRIDRKSVFILFEARLGCR